MRPAPSILSPDLMATLAAVAALATAMDQSQETAGRAIEVLRMVGTFQAEAGLSSEVVERINSIADLWEGVAR